MSLLDKMGKAAMDALDNAARKAEDVRRRVDPLIDKSPIASKLRDKIAPAEEDVEIPHAEVLRRPFETHNEGEDEAPLANPDLPAQIYGRATEPWTGRAAQLLRDRNIEHELVDLAAEGGLRTETRLMRATGQHGGLYIYLRGEHIGGYNALSEIDRLGQLEEMVKAPEEREQRKGRVRIVIPKRGGDETPMGER